MPRDNLSQMFAKFRGPLNAMSRMQQGQQLGQFPSNGFQSPSNYLQPQELMMQAAQSRMAQQDMQNTFNDPLAMQMQQQLAMQMNGNQIPGTSPIRFRPDVRSRFSDSFAMQGNPLNYMMMLNPRMAGYGAQGRRRLDFSPNMQRQPFGYSNPMMQAVQAQQGMGGMSAYPSSQWMSYGMNSQPGWNMGLR